MCANCTATSELRNTCVLEVYLYKHCCVIPDYISFAVDIDVQAARAIDWGSGHGPMLWLTIKATVAYLHMHSRHYCLCTCLSPPHAPSVSRMHPCECYQDRQRCTTVPSSKTRSLHATTYREDQFAKCAAAGIPCRRQPCSTGHDTAKAKVGKEMLTCDMMVWIRGCM